MTDTNAGRILAHQSNIARYRRILGTELTQLERSFVLRRLDEEKSSLRSLMEAGDEHPSGSNENLERAA